jgi:hypothetical protein
MKTKEAFEIVKMNEAASSMLPVSNMFVTMKAENEQFLAASAKPESIYLPHLIFVYAIMLGNCPGGKVNHMAIKDASGTLVLDRPFLATMVGTKKVVKGMTKEGKVIEAPENPKSEEGKRKLAEVMALEKRDTGFAALVHILMPTTDGRTVDTFAQVVMTAPTMAAYMEKPLKAAQYAQGAAIRVDIVDHTPNMKSNKKTNHSFLAAERFTQWITVQVTGDYAKTIAAATDRQKIALQKWINE